MVKYYYAGGQRVAMRKGSSTLYFLLGDHLGSTSITANSSGSKVAELRYHPWGGTRYTDGTTPTSYRFTGQREDATIGLYFYNARYYDPALGRFISADTLVPQAGNPQDLNRYAYVRNNPLRYTDPSGHCIPGWNCPGDLGREDTSPILWGIRFTVDPGQSWHVQDQDAVLNAAQTVARAQVRALHQRNREYARTGDFDLMVDVPASDVLFRQLSGDVAFHQSALSCQDVHGVGCWAFTASPRIIIYTNAPQGGYTFQNAAHELGHLFAQRAGGRPYSDLMVAQIGVNGEIVAGGGWPDESGYQRTNLGYATEKGPWQQNWWTETPNEDFADMFLGWAYNHFARDAYGAVRYQWMNTNMPQWIALAVTGQ